MPLLEISVIPVGSDTASFSSHVASAVHIIQNKGLKYQLTPTSTVIEGELDQLLSAAKEIHQSELKNGTQRVVTHISIDDRSDKQLTLEQQIAIVEQAVQQ